MLRYSGVYFSYGAAVPGGVVTTEPLESKSKAHTAEVAASSCLWRATALTESGGLSCEGERESAEEVGVVLGGRGGYGSGLEEKD
jgi:hypothetical protein